MSISTLKRVYICLSAVLLFTLHLPLVFANDSIVYNKVAFVPAEAKELAITNSIKEDTDLLYDTMQLDLKGLSKTTFEHAMKGFTHLLETGKIENQTIISIIDFSLPSSKKRLFVIDLDKLELVFNTYVAHGVNSGKEMARQFSNIPESNKSSLGFYETLGTYIGGHGYSLRINGLEKGINDNANRRNIVIHGADYVDKSLIDAQGYIGRSWGCPALPQSLTKPIVNTIKNGTCLFIYSADKSYLNKSKIINA